MIKVFTLLLDDADYQPELQEELLQYLPKAGKLRVQDRISPTSKLHTIAGELLARFAISQYTGKVEEEIVLRFGEKGKPYIENLRDIHFNISHSGHYVVCAVAPAEIGIDVERIRKVNLRIAERYFSESEIHDLMALGEQERMNYFITLWTIKESYLKAIGRGLTQHLNSFTDGNEEAKKFGIETFSLSHDYHLSVCAQLPYPPFGIIGVELREIIRNLPKYI
jgi:4'-phosphopantetheinyl transferase